MATKTQIQQHSSYKEEESFIKMIIVILTSLKSNFLPYFRSLEELRVLALNRKMLNIIKGRDGLPGLIPEKVRFLMDVPNEFPFSFVTLLPNLAFDPEQFEQSTGIPIQNILQRKIKHIIIGMDASGSMNAPLINIPANEERERITLNRWEVCFEVLKALFSVNDPSIKISILVFSNDCSIVSKKIDLVLNEETKKILEDIKNNKFIGCGTEFESLFSKTRIMLDKEEKNLTTFICLTDAEIYNLKDEAKESIDKIMTHGVPIHFAGIGVNSKGMEILANATRDSGIVENLPTDFTKPETLSEWALFFGEVLDWANTNRVGRYTTGQEAFIPESAQPLCTLCDVERSIEVTCTGISFHKEGESYKLSKLKNIPNDSRATAFAFIKLCRSIHELIEERKNRIIEKISDNKSKRLDYEIKELEYLLKLKKLYKFRNIIATKIQKYFRTFMKKQLSAIKIQRCLRAFVRRRTLKIMKACIFLQRRSRNGKDYDGAIMGSYSRGKVTYRNNNVFPGFWPPDFGHQGFGNQGLGPPIFRRGGLRTTGFGIPSFDVTGSNEYNSLDKEDLIWIIAKKKLESQKQKEDKDKEIEKFRKELDTILKKLLRVLNYYYPQMIRFPKVESISIINDSVCLKEGIVIQNLPLLDSSLSRGCIQSISNLYLMIRNLLNIDLESLFPQSNHSFYGHIPSHSFCARQASAASYPQLPRPTLQRQVSHNAQNFANTMENSEGGQLLRQASC